MSIVIAGCSTAHVRTRAQGVHWRTHVTPVNHASGAEPRLPSPPVQKDPQEQSWGGGQ